MSSRTFSQACDRSFVTGLSDNEILWFLQNANHFKELISSIECEAIKRATIGTPVSGVEIKRRSKPRKWIDDTEIVIEKLRELGVEEPLKMVPKMVTITDAEKQIGKGAKNKIDGLIQQTGSSLYVKVVNGVPV